MGLVVEYRLSNPLLRRARRAVPEVEIRIEDEYREAGESPTVVFWATGDAAEVGRFETELSSDPTIENVEALAKVPDGRLFRTSVTPDGVVGMTYLKAVTLDITFLEITAKGDEMQYRAHVPGREALSEYCALCEDRDLSFELLGLYRSNTTDEQTEVSQRVTPRQEDALLHALEEGYFSVPRHTSLEDLAASFGISDQAMSALLRRGQTNLIEDSLADAE